MITTAFVALVPISRDAAAAGTIIADPEPMDIGPQIRASGPHPSSEIADTITEASATTAYSFTGSYAVGDQVFYCTGEYGKASYETGSGWMWFTKRVDGAHCEVWTQNDMTFMEGDPRNANVNMLTITDSQARYMANQFDNVIYPIEKKYFSDAPPADGSNEQWSAAYGEQFPSDMLLKTNDAGKVAIMVFNIVDDSFFDPTYPYYIVGYFSPSMQYQYDRNIIHIDCYDWIDRTGPGHGDHSYLIEGTIAHEYQHLLHNYVDPGETIWINEGLSDYAEMLTGYGTPDSHIAHFLATPDNSLTEWGDQGDINILADYGAAAAFMIYLNDHFGGASIVSKLMKSTLHGEQSVTTVLQQNGYKKMTFDTVFGYWHLANLIHSGKGMYNYTSINLWKIGETAIRDYTPGKQFKRSKAAPTLTMEGEAIDGPNLIGTYGTDYLHIIKDKWATYHRPINLALFQGQSIIQADGWKQTKIGAYNYWYSGSGDLRDVWLTTSTIKMGISAGSLQFDAKWNIEEGFDFGFVQVSTDAGKTWTSLGYDLTKTTADETAMPEIVANLPGVTGEQSDFTHVSIDLKAYAGMSVQFKFRYMTDWAYNFDGWYVGNITIGSTVLTKSMQASYPKDTSVNWKVTLYFPATRWSPMKIVDVPINDAKDVGMKILSQYRDYKEMYIVISPNHGPTDYSFSVIR
jgi:hypothetical protein